MTSRAFRIAIALLFIGGVAAYYGMLACTFGHVRGSYVRAIVLASGVALAMGRGYQFSQWLTAGLAACGAASAFQLAFLTYPDGITARGLIIPGATLSLVLLTILLSEAVRRTRKSSHPTDSAPLDGLDSFSTSKQKEGSSNFVSGDRFRRMSAVILVIVGVVLLAVSDQVADVFNRRLSRVDPLIPPILNLGITMEREIDVSA